MVRMENLFQVGSKLAFSRYGFLLFFLVSGQYGMASPESAHDHGESTAAIMPGHASDAANGVGIQNIEGFKVKLEKLIEQTYSASQFFFCCDLMRLYIQRFPYSDKNDLYLSDLLNTTDTSGGANVPDAATTTKWKDYIWVRGLGTSGEAKFYTWNENATSDATYLKWQENNDTPSLVVIKSTLLARGRDSLAKANSADQRLVGISVDPSKSDRSGLSRNQAVENEALILAGGDETLAKRYLADYDVVVGKYLEAAVYLSAHCLIFPNSKDNSQILGDAAKSAEIAGLPLLEIEMRLRLLKRNAVQVAFSSTEVLLDKARSQSRYFTAINILDRFLKQDYGNSKTGSGFVLSGDIHQLAGCYEVAATKYNQALIWCGDMKRINYSENNKSNDFAQEIAAIQRSANLSVGYALLSEAKGRHLRESTAVFAGKLHDQAIDKFETLVKSVESGSMESLDFLLGLVRARVESARYKRLHSSELGLNEIKDAYARCIPVCENYLRVIDLGLTGDENAYVPVIIQDKHEVAFVLMEALFAIDKPESGEGQFIKYFINPTDGGNSKWQALAKAKIAERLVTKGDYLTAYPLLSEVVQEARETGLRDVSFAAALMKGICISKLNPTVDSEAAFVISNIGDAQVANQVSGAQLVRDAYLNALSILNDPSVTSSLNYPVEFRGLFQENIREELVAEFRNELKYLETGWDSLGLSGREALLVEALSNVNPEKSPFNPNNLIVKAFLKAQQ